MKKVAVFLCLAAGLLSGLIFTSLQLSFDDQVRKKLESYLTDTLKKGLKCSFSTQLEHVNLLSGTFMCSNVSACDTQNTWKWSARHAIISFSWFELLFSHELKLTIALQDLQADSLLNQKELTLSHHIKAWINLPPGPIPTKVKNLSIRNGHIEVTYKDQGYEKHISAPTIQYDCQGELAVTSTAVQIACTFNDGQLQFKPGSSFNSIRGACHVTIPRSSANRYTGDINLSGQLCIDSKKPQELFLASTYDTMKGVCLCYTRDRRGHATINWQPSLVKIAGKCNVSLISDFLGNHELPSLTGECNFNVSSSWQELFKKQAHGHISWDALSYSGYLLPKGTATVKLAQDTVLADYQLTYKDIPATGALAWQWGKAQAEGTLANANSLVLPLFGTCQPNQMTLTWNYEHEKFSGTYTLKPQETRPISGSFLADKTTASLEFDCDEHHVQAIALPHPWHLASLEYKKGSNQLAHFTCNAHRDIKGDIDYQCFKETLARALGIETSGSGTLTVTGKIPEVTTLQNLGTHRIPITISLAPTQIRLGSTYNIVEEATLNTEIDLKQWMLFIRDGKCRLNKGEVLIPHLAIAYNPHRTNNSLPFSLSGTLLLHDCFIHWKKDMVSSVSGFLCLSASEHTIPLLKGSIILDKTHIQSNILSSEFEHQLAKNIVKPFASQNQPDIKLNVSVNSHSPVHIQTQFLTADAHFSLMLTGSLKAPELSGTIQVTQGKLNFPYQPLNITQGRVYFLSNQLHDPTFELIAKNRIKKYTITMYANGSLKHPHILFEATPSLTEGQIITLLLGGAEDGSLFLAMPSSLTSTLERLVFGPAESISRIQRYILNLFKPLKSIRIVPGFGDESGRGGLRGSLVIDVGDNLHARIQKNFDLSEDVRIEVEYGLSDTMAVRAVKDERGDVGAEIEKTWKFS